MPYNVDDVAYATGATQTVSRISVSNPVYHCPRHGDVMHVQTLWKDGNALRHWCGECYIEMIDAHCQVVAQIGTKRSET